MRIISSTIRPKIRKVFAIAMFLISFIWTCVCLFALLFSEKKSEKSPIPIIIIVALFLLLLGSFAYFKKREIVYIDKNNFVIKGKKILITNVISIDKRFRKPEYVVRYYNEDDEIIYFILEIDQVMNTPPEFIKKLQVLAAKNNHTPPNLF